MADSTIRPHWAPKVALGMLWLPPSHPAFAKPPGSLLARAAWRPPFSPEAMGKAIGVTIPEKCYAIPRGSACFVGSGALCMGDSANRRRDYESCQGRQATHGPTVWCVTLGQRSEGASPLPDQLHACAARPRKRNDATRALPLHAFPSAAQEARPPHLSETSTLGRTSTCNHGWLPRARFLRQACAKTFLFKGHGRIHDSSDRSTARPRNAQPPCADASAAAPLRADLRLAQPTG